MKLTLEEIDSHYADSGDCDDYHWDHQGPETRAQINKTRLLIANHYGLHESNVKITYCAPVVEYCLYINNTWSGYVDFEDPLENKYKHLFD